MAQIIVKEDIKVLDKAGNLAKAVRNTAIRAKDTTQNLADDGQITSSEYAEDRVKYMAEDGVTDAGKLAQRTTKEAYKGGKKLYQNIRQRQQVKDTVKNADGSRIPNNIFSWPLQEQGRITSYFGYRIDPISGKMSYHSGTDIAMPSGTPILAASDGTVIVANATDNWGCGYGYYVKIRHNDTYDTLYAHCSKICVTYGQQVKSYMVISFLGRGCVR